jgi:hypothetical protein
MLDAANREKTRRGSDAFRAAVQGDGSAAPNSVNDKE